MVIENVVNGTALAPDLYRVLVPTLCHLTRQCLPFLSWIQTGFLWNFIFICLALPLFHHYLRRWFDETVCVALTLAMVFLIPISFLWDYPYDFLELVFFILGYGFIRDGKYLSLCVCVLLATLNRETAGLLAFSYFVTCVSRKDLFKTLFKTALCSLYWFVPRILLFVLRGEAPYRSGEIGFWQGSFFAINLENARSMMTRLDRGLAGFFLFIGVPLLVHFLFYNGKQDPFLRRNVYTVLFFVALTVFTTRINEIRVYYPLLPILIPLCFYPLLSSSAHRE